MNEEDIRAELAAYGAMQARRDELVRAADQAGIPRAQISALMGIGRVTVYRILDSDRR